MRLVISFAISFAILCHPGFAQNNAAESSSAAEPNVNAQPSDNSSALPPVKLFGAVSHSDSLQHVSQSLDKHRKSLKPLSASTDDSTQTVAIAADAAPLKGNADLTKLSYMPMNGIAQPSNEAPKKLSAEVQKYTLEWFMVPKWLAGKWEKAGDLTVSITDLKTGQQVYPDEWTENEQESTWGHQADAAGNVWHVNFLPAEKDGRSSGKIVRFLTLTQKCERTDEQALITRTQYVVSESNFFTAQPTDMFQQESLNHYMPNSPQEVVNNSTNRVFSAEGEALRDGHLQTKFSKVAEFLPTPKINGMDLKLALNDYLEAHGLAHLMTK